ncbi:unnamed protein product [Brassicogethes aeneus]|uniref:Uncharacterized protein n=1 Tax=Brassicogethes aeneus TaxID=1431903 RepID=A0A9P0BD39_BRAAE|nr:unnamed protein product [Brassicogethes aeneus]
MDEARKPSQLSLDGNISANWKKIKQSYQIYMKATEKNLKSEEIKTNIFLSIAGEEAIELFNTLDIKEEDRVKETNVMEAFEAYCNPKKNIVYERFKFYKRQQLDGLGFCKLSALDSLWFKLDPG